MAPSIRGGVPKHIAVILDGNRRFSKRLMMKPFKGHEWGAEKIRKLLEWSKGYGIKELTLYALSVENFNRPKKEFDFLMDLFRKEFRSLKDDPRLAKDGIRINIIGRLWMFPQDIQDMLTEIMAKTKDHTRYILNFAMAYGGRAEVIDATKRIAEQVKEGKLDVEAINEETFSKNLYFSAEPDLIIRTGGEHRTSNFLPFQGAYAEWIFVEKLWPEFEQEDFKACLEEYAGRQRRFGR